MICRSTSKTGTTFLLIHQIVKMTMRKIKKMMINKRSNSKKKSKSKRNQRRQRSRSWRRRRKRKRARGLKRERMMRKMMMSDGFICFD